MPFRFHIYCDSDFTGEPWVGLAKIHCNFEQPRIFIYNLLLYIKTSTNYRNNILFLLHL
jgi:hypothetical protein